MWVVRVFVSGADRVINLVTGAPGSGKSYYAVRVIAEALMSGKPVATNIELRPGWQRRVANLNPLNRVMPWKRRKVEARLSRLLFVSSDLDELFAVRVPGTGEGRFLIVLDECHNWMNSRTWNASESGKDSQTTAINARLRIVKFFTQHRKVGADVYAITQDAANIDRQVRTLFEHHIKLKALHNFKVAGVRVVPIKYFLAIWHWNDGPKTILKRQGYPLTGVRKIYDTMALSHGMEVRAVAATIVLPGDAETIELQRRAVREESAGIKPRPAPGRRQLRDSVPYPVPPLGGSTHTPPSRAPSTPTRSRVAGEATPPV